MNVTFVDNILEGAGIRTFRFKPERPVSYTAGQFIDLTIHHDADARSNRRWFTLSSSPSEELLAITTKLTFSKGSSFKQALMALKPGDTVMMSEPMGDFVLPKDAGIPITFIVGGIGITPVRSIIKWLIDSGEKRTLQLIYSAAKAEEVIFQDVTGTYGLPTTHILSQPPKDSHGLSERLTASVILDRSPDLGNNYYYLSGPEPFVEDLATDMAEAGIPKSRIVTDYFLNYTSV